MLLESLDPNDPRRADVGEIRQAGGQAAALTRQLVAFGRRQVLWPEVVDLNGVVARMTPMLRRLLGEAIELETVLAPDLGAVEVDPVQIEQVIVNLVVNARDAMPDGGRVLIETSDTELGDDRAAMHPEMVPGRYVVLTVSDTGVGIAPEIRDRIFEPFFTTKERGRGTGLGLATVYGVVRQSGGHVWVYSEPGEGTTFKVYLPRVDEAVPVPGDGLAGSLDSTPPERGGGELVLVVEDEPALRGLIARTLEAAGYRVRSAGSPEEALAIVDSLDEPIPLVVTDVVLPGMSGRALGDRVVAARPGTKVLYMSGYAASAIVHHGVLEPGVAFLPKPFTPSALVSRVREALNS